MGERWSGYGPKLSVSRVKYYDGMAKTVTLESPADAVYFGKGDLIEFGLIDDGSRMREGVSMVLGVDRMSGNLKLNAFPPSAVLGDFIFTSPPGKQLDSPWEALREWKKEEVAWLRRVWDALKSRGDQ